MATRKKPTKKKSSRPKVVKKATNSKKTAAKKKKTGGHLGGLMKAQLSAETKATKRAPAQILVREEEPLHRTTITMPQSDRELLEELLLRVQVRGHPASLSSIVRAGIHALDGVERGSPLNLEDAVARAPRLKVGRKAG